MSDTEQWFAFVLAALATWRITHLLAYEDGPWHILVALRRRLGGGALGKLMDCFACLSFWVAALFSFFVCRQLIDLVVVWLALSGAACLLDRVGSSPVTFERLPNQMEEGLSHGMLRTTEDRSPQRSDTAGDAAGDVTSK